MEWLGAADLFPGWCVMRVNPREEVGSSTIIFRKPGLKWLRKLTKLGHPRA